MDDHSQEPNVLNHAPGVDHGGGARPLDAQPYSQTVVGFGNSPTGGTSYSVAQRQPPMQTSPGGLRLQYQQNGGWTAPTPRLPHNSTLNNNAYNNAYNNACNNACNNVYNNVYNSSAHNAACNESYIATPNVPTNDGILVADGTDHSCNVLEDFHRFMSMFRHGCFVVKCSHGHVMACDFDSNGVDAHALMRLWSKK